ncbi:MAG TPA: hypothetical protein VFS67_10105 [Polyangiaceae bacterium]|nr:hypothetical protein [Polyangiaceae bacterium]
MPHDEVLESRIRFHHARGEFAAAATIALQGYGAVVLSYLEAKVRSRQLAGEIFSLFSEQLWRGLPSVRWRSGVRGWVFVLARNAMYQYLLARRRWWGRHVPLSEEPALAHESEPPSEVPACARAGIEEQVWKLREELPEGDQQLLAMRVTQALPWDEVARLMLDQGRASDRVLVRREAARLRKRFQVVKDRLRQRAQEAGLGAET